MHGYPNDFKFYFFIALLRKKHLFDNYFINEVGTIFDFVFFKNYVIASY